jgi:hypothetical protein
MESDSVEAEISKTLKIAREKSKFGRQQLAGGGSDMIEAATAEELARYAAAMVDGLHVVVRGLARELDDLKKPLNNE